MILDTVRAVADWLGHGTYGVAARLAALDLDGTDTVPAGTITIIDETRHDDAAIRREPVTPLITVAADALSSLDGDAVTLRHEADVPLQLTITRSATSPSAVVRDLYYTVRAVVACVESLCDPRIAAAVTACTRNGVHLTAIMQLQAAQVRQELSDTTGTAAVLVTVRVRDTLA